MADDTVTIRFGARLDELVKGVDQVKAKLADIGTSTRAVQEDFLGLSDKMEGAVDGLTQQFASLNKVIAAGGVGGSTEWIKVILGGGLLGGAAAATVSIFSQINTEMRDTAREAKEVGLSLDKFQSLRFAVAFSGVDTKTFAADLEKASQHLNDLQYKTGELSKLLDANNISWKDANGNIISMDRYLEIANKLVRDAREPDKFKIAELLGFSRKWVETLQLSPAAFNEIIKKAHESGAVLNDDLLNKAAEFERKWSESAATWANGFKAMIVELTPFVASFIEVMGKGFTELWNITKGVGQNVKEWFTGAAMTGVIAQMKEGLFPSSGTGKDIFSIALARLPQIEASTAAWHKELKAATDEADKLSLAVVKALEGAAPSHPTTVPGEVDTDAIRASIEKLHGEIRVAQINFQSLSNEMTAGVKTFATTEREKTAILLTELDKQHVASLALFAEELKMPDMTKVQEQRVNNEKLEELATYASKRKQIIDQAAVAETKSWVNALTPIQAAFDSQLRGLLAGTTSMSAAMKAIFADLVLDIIRNLEKMLIVNTIAAQMKTAFGGISGAIDLTGFIKQIGAAVASTYAGAAAYFAPFLGPAAPAAAAVVAATVGAVAAGLMAFSGPKAEQGAWNIPATSPWLLHRGETVLPAQAAEGFRRMASGGGGSFAGGGSVVIQAWDGADVVRTLQRHAPLISRIVGGYQGANPSSHG